MKNLSTLEELMLEIDQRNSKPFVGWFYRNGWFSYNFVYLFKHPLEIFDNIFRQIHWAWQRVFRGWDDRVIWSIDVHLCEIIPVWIRELKNQKQGIPGRLFGDNNYNPNSKNYHTFPGTDETAIMKYNAILDIIIEGFEILKKDYFDRSEEDQKKIHLAFKFLEEYFETLWD
jgi:hypothetical protein